MGEQLRRLPAAILAAGLACTGSAADPPAAPPAGAPLVGGVARTPAEVARCREEEMTRIGRGDRRGRVLPPAEPVRLRSKPIDLPVDGCEASARRFNFYADTNEQGCFVNAFRGSGGTLIADLATRLVWTHVPPIKSRTFKEAKQAVASLDARRSDGYSDWRLPTTEELLSLVETLSSGTSNFDSALFGGANHWWSADHSEKGRVAWIVGSSAVGCRPAVVRDPDEKAHVVAVRSMREGESFDEPDPARRPGP